MLHNFSRYLSLYLIQKEIIGEKEEEIYTYGFELFWSTFLAVMSILCVSVALNNMLFGLIFVGVFIPMRTFSGGFHADTYLGCFIFTNLAFLFTLLLANCIYRYIIMWYPLFLAASAFCIVKYAPIEHKNNPLSEKKRKKNKRYAITGLLIIIAIVIVLNICSNLFVLSMVVSTTTVVSIMMFIKCRGRKKYEFST